MHLGASEYSKVPETRRFSLINHVSEAVQNTQLYKKTSSISSMFFGLYSPKNCISPVETGIFSLGMVYFWSSVFIPNKERLKTAGVLFGISLLPHLFSLRNQGSGFYEREDTFFSQSASALSLVAASYYLKTKYFK